MKILGLGDSTTAGTPGFRSPIESPPDGAGDPQSQYAYWIRAFHPEWMVRNCGVNGERSDEVLRRFSLEMNFEVPDYLVILAGVNDVFQGREIAPVQKNLGSMYEGGRRAGARVVAASVLPFDRMTPRQHDSIRALNHWIRDEAGRSKLLFCDTYSVVTDPRDPARLAGTPDGLHPNVEGYRRMGEAITLVIEAAERERPTR